MLDMIEKTPTELDTLYADALQRVDEEERAEMTKLFQWICYSTQPLSLDETRHILAMKTHPDFNSIGELKRSVDFPETRKDAQSAIKHLSRGLIEVKSHTFTPNSASHSSLQPTVETETVEFIRESVSDFFRRGGFSVLLPPEPNSSATGLGHFHISRSCLKLLLAFMSQF